MIVDSSAMVAILRQESTGDLCLRTVLSAPVVRISAAGYLETAIVLTHVPLRELSAELEELLDFARIVIEPVTAEQAQIAREAHRRYGRGSRHRARLNFGDCFAYEAAKERKAPLLYVGDDFARTDIEGVL